MLIKLIGQEGAELNSEKLLKWQFYSVVSEEMTACSDVEDNMLQARQLRKHNNAHVVFPREKENVNLSKAPTCMTCSLEEGVMRSAIDHVRKRQEIVLRG